MQAKSFLANSIDGNLSGAIVDDNSARKISISQVRNLAGYPFGVFWLIGGKTFLSTSQHVYVGEVWTEPTSDYLSRTCPSCPNYLQPLEN